MSTIKLIRFTGKNGKPTFVNPNNVLFVDTLVEGKGTIIVGIGAQIQVADRYDHVVSKLTGIVIDEVEYMALEAASKK